MSFSSFVGRIGIGLFGVAAIVACSSSSADGTPSGACGAAYDAAKAYTTKCTPRDASEGGDRGRFVQQCQMELAAPGVASNAVSSLQSCANAIQSVTAACGQLDESVCETPQGTLATGIPCGADDQCASGYCQGAGISGHLSADGSVTYSESCGQCADTIADGQPCSSYGRCGRSSTCVLGASGGTCVAQTESDVGGSCAQPARCKPGLRCDGPTLKCAALSDVGGPCASGDEDCKNPLVCTQNRTCAQGVAEGGACGTGDVACDRSTVCDSVTKTCKVPQLVEPGGACDGQVLRCRVGACDTSTSSAPTPQPPPTCPQVIADGQPCTQPMTGKTCDSGAYCTDGKCAVFDPSTCK